MWRGKFAAIRHCALGVFALLIASCLSTEPGIASEWTERAFAKFRLLPNLTAVDTSDELLIGLEIDLDPGWQFYSNKPGELGVAPTFDWTPSLNLGQASVYWPKPTRYHYSTDPPASTYGYKGSLLLPVVLEPMRVSEALDVRLNLEYAVCDDYCVIDTVRLHLMLPAGRSLTTRHSERLQQALTSSKVNAW